MDILVFRFYGYIRYYFMDISNIFGEYFDKIINRTKSFQNLWQYLDELKKNDKISKNKNIKLFYKYN